MRNNLHMMRWVSLKKIQTDESWNWLNPYNPQSYQGTHGAHPWITPEDPSSLFPIDSLLLPHPWQPFTLNSFHYQFYSRIHINGNHMVYTHLSLASCIIFAMFSKIHLSVIPFKVEVLRYNLLGIKFTPLKWTIWWVLKAYSCFNLTSITIQILSQMYPVPLCSQPSSASSSSNRILLPFFFQKVENEIGIVYSLFRAVSSTRYLLKHVYSVTCTKSVVHSF